MMTQELDTLNDPDFDNWNSWHVVCPITGDLLTTLYAPPEVSHDDMCTMVAVMSMQQRERGWFKRKLVVQPAPARN